MARRHIHYEAAFEDYLRGRAVPYVPVDEARRMIFAGDKMKSFDFLVYPGGQRHWLVDVKGRQFPYLTRRGGKRYWENWVSQGDIDSMLEWQTVFGEEFEARFVFAYVLEGPPDRWPPARPHAFEGNEYAFFAVTLADYQRHCRRRSAKWDTVSIGAETFRQIVHAVELCGAAQA